ncbi:hypothetical protein CC86DRAFT_422032 [Ophiobolus disseminans]|uniref:Uncharacterized protein n=1 Tax=Ophiobolus disseminans TaxID=1469910 RepID=A0A6A6ZQ87_9PLEO|nr:hypothetical protein CC86DRAFT_422032 [Ophiobolus disseminans]
MALPPFVQNTKTKFVVRRLKKKLAPLVDNHAAVMYSKLSTTACRSYALLKRQEPTHHSKIAELLTLEEIEAPDTSEKTASDLALDSDTEYEDMQRDHERSGDGLYARYKRNGIEIVKTEHLGKCSLRWNMPPTKTCQPSSTGSENTICTTVNPWICALYDPDLQTHIAKGPTENEDTICGAPLVRILDLERHFQVADIARNRQLHFDVNVQ